MRYLWAKQKGFTIVELLIVIVVIGILAAITIVAYNGISQRARDAKRKEDVAMIGKAMSLWTLDTGKLFSAMNSGNGAPADGYFSADYGGGSVKTVLVNGNYLSNGVSEPMLNLDAGVDYMVSLCTDGTDNRRVVMSKLEVAPTQTIANQLLGSGCNNSHINSYITFYFMNYAIVTGNS